MVAAVVAASNGVADAAATTTTTSSAAAVSSARAPSTINHGNAGVIVSSPTSRCGRSTTGHADSCAGASRQRSCAAFYVECVLLTAGHVLPP
jgi:hypothetical protein